MQPERLGRRALRAVLLAAALYALIDVGCRYLLPPSGTVTRYDSAERYLLEAPVPDIQIVGDSVAYHGLIGSALAPDDLHYARNDALSGTRLPFSYYLLRRQFQAGRGPRAIVVAYSPFGLHEASVGNMAAEFLHGEELLEVALSRRWSDALYGLVARASYIVMNRQSFRQLLMNADPRFFVTPTSRHLHEPPADAGLLEGIRAEWASLDRREPVPEDIDDLLEFSGLATFTVAEETDRYFRKLMALAESHDVPLYWVTLPIRRSVRRYLDETGFEAELLRYLAIHESAGRLVVLQGEFVAYEDDLFVDILHPTWPISLAFSCHIRRKAALAIQPAALPIAKSSIESAARRAALEEQTRARVLLAEMCDNQTISQVEFSDTLSSPAWTNEP